MEWSQLWETEECIQCVALTLLAVPRTKTLALIRAEAEAEAMRGPGRVLVAFEPGAFESLVDRMALGRYRRHRVQLRTILLDLHECGNVVRLPCDKLIPDGLDSPCNRDAGHDGQCL